MADEPNRINLWAEASVAAQEPIRCQRCGASDLPGAKPTIEVTDERWAYCTICGSAWYIKGAKP